MRRLSPAVQAAHDPGVPIPHAETPDGR